MDGVRVKACTSQRNWGRVRVSHLVIVVVVAVIVVVDVAMVEVVVVVVYSLYLNDS